MANTYRDRKEYTNLRYRTDPVYRQSVLDSNRRYRLENKEKYSASKRRYNYGMTKEQHDAMLAGQNSVCKVCKNPPTGKRNFSRLHVDHDHASGKIRGLLCADCNLALGHAKDNPDRLMALAQYLRDASE